MYVSRRRLDDSHSKPRRSTDQVHSSVQIAEDGKKPTFDTMRSLRFITYGIAVAPIST
jgi:hypothetical protein